MIHPYFSVCLSPFTVVQQMQRALFLEAQEEDLFSSFNFFNVVFMKKAELKAFPFLSVKMKLENT